MDIRILNSQSAYLENESHKGDKGRRSVKTGDESPSWQRNRLCPIRSGLVWSDGSTNEREKKERNLEINFYYFYFISLLFNMESNTCDLIKLCSSSGKRRFILAQYTNKTFNCGRLFTAKHL